MCSATPGLSPLSTTFFTLENSIDSLPFPKNENLTFPSSCESNFRLSDKTPKSLLRRITKLTPALKKIEEKIDLYNEEVKHVKTHISFCRGKIHKLQGGKYQRLPWIGILIKYIFQWINLNKLALVYREKGTFENKLKEYRKKIDDLQKLLNDKENELNQAFHEFHSKDISKEKVVNCESSSEGLEANYSLKQEYSKAAKDAAAKGYAAQAGFKAIELLAQQNPLISKNSASSQEVFIRQSEGVVFKRLKERAREEEALLNSLLDLTSNQAAVGSFRFKQASLDKFGIQIPSEIKQRGFDLQSASIEFQDGVKSKLSPKELLILKKHCSTPHPSNPEQMLYDKISKEMIFIKKKDQKQGNFEPFQHIQNQFLANKIDLTTFIGYSADSAISLEKHHIDMTDLIKVLNYIPSIHSSPSTLILIPDLTSADINEAYTLCEKYEWIYQDNEKIEHTVDFKTIHRLYIENNCLEKLRANTSEQEQPSSSQLNKALNAPWKVISPDLMEEQKHDISTLTNVEAKPFIEEMILMSSLNDQARRTVLNRLTPDGEFNAILTGELQFLDLHSQNIGFIPHYNEQHEKFKEITFEIESITVSFSELLQMYLNQRLPLTTLICYNNNGSEVKKTITDLPDLQEALNVQWDLIFFDTDLSLTEDNFLQDQTLNKVHGHLIPLHSAFLETKWKDKPLSEETVKRLMNSQGRDHKVHNWILKKEAAIYQQLNQSEEKKVKEYIDPYLQKWNLSDFRRKNEKVTIEKLKRGFVEEICQLPQHIVLWKIIEKALSSVRVYQNETHESLSVRCKLSLDEIRQLAPVLLPGKELLLPYDLTSNSPTANKKRETIAKMLFPRLTYRQIIALEERQRSRKDYLIHYYSILQSTDDKITDTQLEGFIQADYSPLSSLRKQKLLARLKETRGQQIGLSKLKKIIIDECCPTYFNLMKAMYPLLADVYEINIAAYTTPQEAGHNIGSYNEPIEKALAIAKKKFPRESEINLLAQKVEAQIKKMQFKAFFGHWITK